MNLFIAVIIVSVVVAPILWIMPSPRQKRQIALREKAMAMGLQVKVCDLPQTRRSQVRAEPAVQGVVYRMPFKRGKSNDSFEYVCLRDVDETIVDETMASKSTILTSDLVNALDGLPTDIVALEYSNSGLAVYWQERGNIEEVEVIYQQLVALKNTLMQTADSKI